jgi:hypothetical protein
VITERATFLMDVATAGLVGPTVVVKMTVRLTSVPKIFQKLLAGTGVAAEGVRNAVLATNPTTKDTRANLEIKIVTIHAKSNEESHTQSDSVNGVQVVRNGFDRSLLRLSVIEML